jgi:hypothetical protein
MRPLFAASAQELSRELQPSAQSDVLCQAKSLGAKTGMNATWKISLSNAFNYN